MISDPQVHPKRLHEKIEVEFGRKLHDTSNLYQLLLPFHFTNAECVVLSLAHLPNDAFLPNIYASVADSATI